MDIEEAYELYVEKVYRFFYIKSLNRQIAEDLTSKTFLVIVERVQEGEDNVRDSKKFIYGVMRNIWLMYLRDKYQRHEQETENIDTFSGYVDTTVHEYESESIKRRAEKYIGQLPEKQRQIVAMRLLEEIEVKDIAEMLGKDRNYVKTTYKRGMKHLKKLIGNPPILEKELV